ncbi:MAG: GNAT family N-acetyltransferase [Candidatus Izemoplasmataceae bacterium]
MQIKLALNGDADNISKYDRHIDSNKLEDAIKNQFVYVLNDASKIVGVLRYSYFWQSIPFLDLINIDITYQKQGYGKSMMDYWEKAMKKLGYNAVMLSTQEDENAQYFYEKLGYKYVGKFLPPHQDAYELMYSKEL